MNKVMKLFPLHKQPIGIKYRCWQLLKEYFDQTPDLLVLNN